jgi:hypothetical protein
MLELWRPPRGAGDPIGCLATTFTFTPGLFDEQCLAHFLGIESEPDREDLAFLLERETRLGGVYAGVLVDHTQAGVEHSLRWDVLPVRIGGGKQHAKLTLLAWSGHLRLVVASANLSEAGYRSNFEVAGAVDLGPAGFDPEMLETALDFLRGLLDLVARPGEVTPAVERAGRFLDHVERLTASWKPRKSGPVRQRLIVQRPETGRAGKRPGVLAKAIEEFRRRGGAPAEVRVASPFFDVEDDDGRVVAELCRSMARGSGRRVTFCVPAAGDDGEEATPRLAAPRTLIEVPPRHGTEVEILRLPLTDEGNNARPWHAKMTSLVTRRCRGLLIGSSNLTCAGMGVGGARNAEANLLNLVERGGFLREAGALRDLWPEMDPVEDPEEAEWLGAAEDQVEEGAAATPPVPAGFVSVTYRAGDRRELQVVLDSKTLPEAWSIHAVGSGSPLLIDRATWLAGGGKRRVVLPWAAPQPPEKLAVRWSEGEGFLPINALDGSELPPPAQLEEMTADEMLRILAAADPSAAIRSWGRSRAPQDALFDDELDSAVPVDLDPLRSHDLEATFLHRVRRRARVLAQLRATLERPAWGRQALEWRLRGLIGVDALATRLLRELDGADGRREEGLLALADFLVVLDEVKYAPVDGALPQREFEAVYRPYLSDLAARLGADAFVSAGGSEGFDPAVVGFWQEVEARCRR